MDAIGDGLKCATDAAADHTEDHPLTPELFWEYLTGQGFTIPGDPPGSEEHGRFFAHLVLDHALASGRIAGNPVQHHYWPR
jgi:hypothetical protein